MSRVAEGVLQPFVDAAVYPSLAGRKVIVSGGASGIGEGIVEAFVRQGSAVAFVDVLEVEGEALVRRLADAPIAPVFVRCDITDSTAYASQIGELIGRLGGCDVLVNNAANDDRHKLEDVTPAYWDERMAVNLKHQFFAAQTVIPAMRDAGRGSIVNLGSVSWHLGMADLAVYQVAKAAIEGLTRSLAREVGRDGIRVNTIVPGNVLTPRQLQWYDPKTSDQCDRSTAWKRRRDACRTGSGSRAGRQGPLRSHRCLRQCGSARRCIRRTE